MAQRLLGYTCITNAAELDMICNVNITRVIISNYSYTFQWKKVFAERYRLRNNWLKGRCTVRTFEGHSQGISCVQFDDTRIVSGSSDKTIKVSLQLTSRCMSILVFPVKRIQTFHSDSSLPQKMQLPVLSNAFFACISWGKLKIISSTNTDSKLCNVFTRVCMDMQISNESHEFCNYCGHAGVEYSNQCPVVSADPGWTQWYSPLSTSRRKQTGQWVIRLHDQGQCPYISAGKEFFSEQTSRLGAYLCSIA